MDNIVTEEIVNEGSPITENNMTSEEINNIAKARVEDVKRAHARLEEIQDACTHKEVGVELINGALRTTCRYCFRAVGYPTQEQAEQSGYTT